jgi:outer membrane immunogenic protein
MAFAILLTVPAFAADPAFVAAPTWTGVYCGAGAGGDWGRFDIESHIYDTADQSHEHLGNDPQNTSADDAWNPVSADVVGPFATVICGYDQQVGSALVLGLSADVDLQDKHGRFENPHDWGNPNTTFQGQRWDVGLGVSGTLAARGGVLVSPNLLVFGIAGWTWANASLEYFGGCVPVSCGNIAGSSTQMVQGPTFGAGIEALFGDNWSTRFEYRFTRLESITTNSTWDMGDQWSGIATASIIDHSMRATLVYRP